MTICALEGKKLRAVDEQGLMGVRLRLMKRKQSNSYIATTGNEPTLM